MGQLHSTHLVVCEFGAQFFGFISSAFFFFIQKGGKNTDQPPIAECFFTRLSDDMLLHMISLAEDPTLLYIMLLGLDHTTRALVRGKMRILSFSGIHCSERIWSFFPPPPTDTSSPPWERDLVVTDPARSPTDGDSDLANPTLGAGMPIPTADALAALVGPCTRLEELTLAPERALWRCGRWSSAFGGWVEAAFKNHTALHSLRIPNMAGLSEGALCAILSQLDGQLRLLEVNTITLPAPGPLPAHVLFAAVVRHCPRVEVLRLGLRDACTQRCELWVTRAGELVKLNHDRFELQADRPLTDPRLALRLLPDFGLTTTLTLDFTDVSLAEETAFFQKPWTGLRHLTMYTPECPPDLMPQALLDRLTDLSLRWGSCPHDTLVITSASLRTLTCGRLYGRGPTQVRLDCPRLEALRAASKGGPVSFQLNTPPRLRAIETDRVVPLCPEALAAHEAAKLGFANVLERVARLRQISGLHCGTVAEVQALIDRLPCLVTLQRIELVHKADDGALVVPPQAALRSLELILSAESAGGHLAIRAPGLVHLDLGPGSDLDPGSGCTRVTLDTPGLRHLHLRDGITDVRLACPLPRLRSLRVGDRQATLGVEAFERLLAAPLPQLRALHCSVPRLGSAEVGLVILRWLALGAPSLTSLSLADVDLEVLDVTPLPRLARLQLTRCRLARRGLKVAWDRMEEVTYVECEYKDVRRTGKFPYAQCPWLLE
ncbi:hypothetical protein PAPYR_8182 [Paratrimastix pyriformis]|uniref:Uncharacterized protein n=1 Tax=Paratrimastix pyriformis TaxID=342808 RepID=A0ABQ8UB72_9EUKA|nr:hypothetical protein PAPYR_8182 [Paratrimastix pyriformis]